MFRGFYTAGSGMIAQQRRTEMLANNMANANTPGFKAEQSTIRSFPEMFMSTVNATRIPTEKGLRYKGLTPVGPLSTGVYMQETLPLFTQGSLRETGMTTDVALIDVNLPVNTETGERGTVFFRLENENGNELYTRNGNFTIDANGNLTNPMGYYVLDANGQRIQLQNDEFSISDTGVIMQDGATVATLGVSFAEQPSSLLKQDNGLFASQTGNLPGAQGGYSYQQGYLEGSNVDAAKTMTDMLAAFRAFEANQKILQAYDRSMEKAVNEIGRVN
ncbi:flagellar hook-basal body protein [Sporosarcina thermotolerans]|uniref:Flagellar hook-basal body protein n=1 Tax=Sporosarcina thermotolerans TaxID=633404 RepID=A0AAW9A5A4_9BACL|nr:flagellar hook-basal body protein [Sporosarcina thermotolerans]MDW0116367.1 flagellar hook-basal body protein [Sporosarcina thermotolerans]WHT48329.1 flagellar hook-basal body protein [Sporosarcina thermotolerans]